MTTRELLEKITVDDIKLVMSKLGTACVDKRDQGELWFRTVCHKGSKFKLCYYIESKRFYCYTHCGPLSIFDVVGQTLNRDYLESKQYIMNVLGMDEFDLSIPGAYQDRITDELVYLDEYEEILSYEREEIELKVYDEYIMELFSDYYYRGWIEDGISIESMIKYGIKYSSIHRGIIIPHRDILGRLVGIRRRSLVEEEIAGGQKYMPIKVEHTWYTHPLQFNLYGLDKTKDYIKKCKRIVIVESEKGVLQLDTMYGEKNNSVALSSSNLSNYQRDMILELGVEEVVLALDKQYKVASMDDEEYRKYHKKIVKLAKKFSPYVNVSIIWDLDDVLGYKDSPTDRGKEVFEFLYGKRRWM